MDTTTIELAPTPSRPTPEPATPDCCSCNLECSLHEGSLRDRRAREELAESCAPEALRHFSDDPDERVRQVAALRCPIRHLPLFYGDTDEQVRRIAAGRCPWSDVARFLSDKDWTVRQMARTRLDERAATIAWGSIVMAILAALALAWECSMHAIVVPPDKMGTPPQHHFKTCLTAEIHDRSPVTLSFWWKKSGLGEGVAFAPPRQTEWKVKLNGVDQTSLWHLEADRDTWTLVQEEGQLEPGTYEACITVLAPGHERRLAPGHDKQRRNP